MKLLSDIVKVCDVSKLICKIMPLDKTPEAIQMMKARKCDGKILINCQV